MVRDAVDPEGNAIVSWAGMGEGGGYDVVRAAYKPVGGSWEAPVELSADGGNSFPSDVVFDVGGNAALVWQRQGGSGNVVQAAYRPAGEEWEAPVDLSEEGKQGMDAVVVLDAPGDSTAADGNATAVWVSETAVSCGEKGGSCPSSVVQAAGYDPEGLPEVELEVPVEGTVGESVEISTPTEELFAPLLEFGDGESVADTEASHVYEEPGEYEVTLGGAEVLGYRASAQRTIVIAAAGPEDEPEPEPETKPELPQPDAGGTQTPPAAGSAGDPGPTVPPVSPQCLAASTARDAAHRRLVALGSAWRHATAGTPKAARLLAAKRAQAAALRRARYRVASFC